jgi:hypothetical protein
LLRNDSVYAAGSEAYSYYQQLSKSTLALLQQVNDTLIDFILSPPSRRHDAEPYRAAFRVHFPDATDLSGAFARNGSVSAGESRDVASLLASLSFSTTIDLSSASSLLIVDDVYSSGTTAAAIVQLLCRNGLPSHTAITIAAPLYVGA